jgi:hypothetical protein
MTKSNHQPTSRRGFLGSIAAGTAALGLTTLAAPINAIAAPDQTFDNEDPDTWFNKIKGKHRVIFDVPEAKGVMPFAWSRVYLLTNQATGTAAKDCSVVVVLRHEGIPFAFGNSIWEKYKFGDLFKVTDTRTKATATSNPFWMPKPDDYKFPGIGAVNIGVNDLQADGVMFCVCNAAMTVYSAVAADQMQMKAEDVMKEWKAGLLPGVQVVPSGVWAVGRAQEHGCNYIFAG